MYEQTNRILKKNYTHYLIPAILVSLGSTLQQFVDTVIVSNLLGSYAMTVENYAGPLTKYCNFAVYLIGVGGAVVFARFMGDMERPKAEQVYRVCMLAALILGIGATIPGFIFIDDLTVALGASEELQPYLRDYLVPTLILIPINILVMTFGCFLTPMGYPRVTSVVILGANIINVCLDLVYIGCFHMDVDGAQWATVSGYVVAVVGLFIYLKWKKIILPSFKGKYVFRRFWEAFANGITPSLSQLGLIIYYAYFNNLITDMGGSSAMTVFSLCLQILSIFSILSQGVCSTIRTFLGVYFSYEDTKEIRYILRVSMMILAVWGVVLFLFVQFNTGMFLDLYNIQENRDLATAAICTYSWLVLFKGFVLISRDYYNVTKHKYLSMGITIVEGSVGVIILGTILSNTIGLSGVWISFPINTFIVFVFVMIRMFCDGTWSRKKHEDKAGIYACTLPMENLDIGKMHETVEAFGRSLSFDQKTTDYLILLIEETYVFTKKNAERVDYIDFLIRRLDDKAYMLVRSLGQVFNPIETARQDDSYNFAILEKLPDSLKYEYVLGMNTVKVEFQLEGKEAQIAQSE